MEHEKTLQRKNSIVLEIFHPLVVYKGLVYSLSFCPFFCLECKKKPTQPFDKGWQWPSFSCSCLNVVKTHGMLLLLSFGFCSLLELRTTFWFSIYCWNQNTTFPFHCSGLQFPAAVSLFPSKTADTAWISACLGWGCSHSHVAVEMLADLPTAPRTSSGSEVMTK